jgi:hypothetical protein
MFQLYSGKKSRDFKQAHLNNTAQAYRRNETNFLAFDGLTPKNQVIEYQKADLSDYTSKSQDIPLQEQKLHDAPILDNEFNKKGVFKFKYDGIGNPVAYGDDYNMDMGGEKPMALGYYKNNDREKMQVADYIKKDMHYMDRFKNVKPKEYLKPGHASGLAGKPNISPLLAYKNLQERQNGSSNPSAYRSHIDPLKAYELYGYREGTDWTRNKNKQIEKIPNQDRKYDDENYIGSFNIKKRQKENSLVISTDAADCAVGSTTVNGTCVPFKSVHSQCNEGYVMQHGYGCIPTNNRATFTPKQVSEKQQGKTPICPPGWNLNKEGNCSPSKEFKKENSTADDSESSSTCTLIGIILGVIIIMVLIGVAIRAMMSDNQVDSFDQRAEKVIMFAKKNNNK